MPSHLWRLIAAGLVLCAVGGVAAFAPSARAQSGLSVTIDPSSAGKTFDGMGIVSAGAESRLLYDEIDPYRSDILDYLFCSPYVAALSGFCQNQADGHPAYGAAWQTLKVEVGGDTNSSQGAEGSFLRTAAEYNALQTGGATSATCHFNRSYEFWLMQQARDRDPNIQLGALSWGAPGYLSNGNSHPFYSETSQQYNTVTYLVDFARCAAAQGTPLNFIGAWNERAYHDRAGGTFDYRPWVDELKQALTDAFNAGQLPTPVRVACCDWAFSWDDQSNAPVISDILDTQGDPAFTSSVDIVGVHYPTTAPPANASMTTQPRWVTEDNPGGGLTPQSFQAGSGDWPIAQNMIKDFATDYLDYGATSDLFVTPVDSFYGNLPGPDTGLLRASWPWSGHYELQAASWIGAQITQFTQPSWKFANSGSCFIGTSSCTDPGGNTGSYLSLYDPASGNWSTVIETVGGSQPLDLTLCPAGNLLTPNILNVAITDQTNFFYGSQSVALQRDPDGCYRSEHAQQPYALQPNTIYSFTTLQTPYHGNAATPPPAEAFPFPYFEDFDSTAADTANATNCAHPTYSAGGLPCWISDQEGAFAVATNCGSNSIGGSGGKCLEQQLTQSAIKWDPTITSEWLTIVGDPNWGDYDTSVRFRLEHAGGVALVARAAAAGGAEHPPRGYELHVFNTGHWDIGVINDSGSYQSSYSCTTTTCALTVGTTWHKFGLRVQGATISAYFDGSQIYTFSDSTYSSGSIEFGTTTPIKAMFDDVCTSNAAQQPGDCLP